MDVEQASRMNFFFVLQSHQLQGRQSREDDDGEKLNMIERLEKAEGRIMSLEKQVRGSFS